MVVVVVVIFVVLLLVIIIIVVVIMPNTYSILALKPSLHDHAHERGHPVH